jgi:hypothetical protein
LVFGCGALGIAQTHPVASPAAGLNPALTAKLPDAASAMYVPLTPQQKFEIFARRVYSPYEFGGVLFNATYAQMTDHWPGYGQGMEGWGKRIGATYADRQVRGFLQSFLLPTLLHQDPRYFRSTKKGLFPRGWYAATRVLVTRKDTGENTFNSSQLLGTLFTASVHNAYYPERNRGFGDTMSRAFGAFVSDATSNVLREFWPDIRRILRRHTPEKIKEVQDKLPLEAIQKVTQTPGVEAQPAPKPQSNRGRQNPQQRP